RPPPPPRPPRPPPPPPVIGSTNTSTSYLSRRLPWLNVSLVKVLYGKSNCSRTQRVQPAGIELPVSDRPMRGGLSATASLPGAVALPVKGVPISVASRSTACWVVPL